MRTSEEMTNIIGALIEFHKKLEQPKRSADNPFFNSKYVPLGAVQELVDGIAPELGLVYVQNTFGDDNSSRTGVQTTLFHSSGEWMRTDVLWMPSEKNTAQAVGSAITYAKRYQLSALFGISADEDDDGNAASGNGEAKSNEPMTLEKAQKMKVTFGKHNGKLLTELADDDPSYLNWLYKADMTKADMKEAIKILGQEKKRLEVAEGMDTMLDGEDWKEQVRLDELGK